MRASASMPCQIHLSVILASMHFTAIQAACSLSHCLTRVAAVQGVGVAAAAEAMEGVAAGVAATEAVGAVEATEEVGVAAVAVAVAEMAIGPARE